MAFASSALTKTIGGSAGGIIGDLTNPLVEGLNAPVDAATQAAIANVTPLAQPISGDQLAQSGALANAGAQSQQELLQALQAQGGLQHQNEVYGQQQALSNQLGQIAAGQGPNPAQAMLAQQTGANVSNQAALMAGQRGAGANSGLIARQAAMQGGALQQQATGQAATMQAQQSLGALQAQQAQQAQMAALANNQVGAQIGATNQYAQTGQNIYGTQLGAAQGQNQQALQQQQIKAGLAGGNIGSIQSLNSGLLSGAGSAATAGAGKAKGGEIKSPKVKMAEGGTVNPQMSQQAIMKENYSKTGGKKPSSITAHHFFGYAVGGSVQNMESGGHVPGQAKVGGTKDSYANDTVQALLSPGEWVIPRSVTQSANPKEAAMKFVDTLIAKKNRKEKK